MLNTKAKSAHSLVPEKICCLGRNRSIKAYLVPDDDDYYYVDVGGYLLGRDAASPSNRFP
jgi:hypothetical protein